MGDNKVIFLDFDGVLKSAYNKGRYEIVNDKFTEIDDLHLSQHDYFDKLHGPAIDNFNKIIDATGARIVISSTWRVGDEMYFGNLIKYMKFCGIKGRVIDRTGQLVGLTIDGKEYKQRGDEIRAWLENHTEVTKFVVLDDDSDMDSVRDNFVHIHGGWVSGNGLEENHALQAIAILNKEI